MVPERRGLFVTIHPAPSSARLFDLFSEALGAVELRWRHRNRGRRRLDRGCRAFIAREGTHITLTAEAYKLHVQISAGGVKDRADANKVAIVHQTASTNF